MLNYILFFFAMTCDRHFGSTRRHYSRVPIASSSLSLSSFRSRSEIITLLTLVDRFYPSVFVERQTQLIACQLPFPLTIYFSFCELLISVKILSVQDRCRNRRTLRCGSTAKRPTCRRASASRSRASAMSPSLSPRTLYFANYNFPYI